MDGKRLETVRRGGTRGDRSAYPRWVGGCSCLDVASFPAGRYSDSSATNTRSLLAPCVVPLYAYRPTFIVYPCHCLFTLKSSSLLPFFLPPPLGRGTCTIFCQDSGGFLGILLSLLCVDATLTFLTGTRFSLFAVCTLSFSLRSHSQRLDNRRCRCLLFTSSLSIYAQRKNR